MPRALPTLCLLLGLLAACTPPLTQRTGVAVDPASPTAGATQQPSQTPFPPLEPTPTPTAYSFWMSPTLPDELRAPLEGLERFAGRIVTWTEDPTQAHLRFEAQAQVALYTHVFALVAPFPTIRDGVSMEGFHSLWGGKGEIPGKLYLSPETAHVLVPVLGELAESDQTFITEADLLQTAWDNRPAFAIVPFEDLEPRWKVLRIEGLSPIDKSFERATYPLYVNYGLSGDQPLIEIFQQGNAWPVSNRDPSLLTDVVMTGVTALTRATAWQMKEKGITYPAEIVAPRLRAADFLHISNEVSFWEDCPEPRPVREGLIFCSATEYIELLDYIGVDLVELTGNHIKDFGTEGLLQSLELYREREWQTFGGGEDLEDSLTPALVEHNGNRLAFIGCNAAGPPSVWATEESPGAAPCSEESLFEGIRQLRSEGYLPIFTYQHSEFYTATPTTKQKMDFRRPIDEGAVIVSGSQAHQPQAFEFYEDGFIHYGLGNLFFDQMWSLSTRQEFVDRHVFYAGRHISTEVISLILENFAQPRETTAEERASFLQAIFSASGW